MDLSRRAQDGPEARHHNRTMDTVTSATPGSGPAGSALLWAGAVGWLGAMGLAALSTLWWVTAGVVVAVAEAIHPELEPSPDSSGLVMVTVLAAVVCLAVSLGTAWAVAQTPGAVLSGWLVGTASGVFGSLTGYAVLCAALGIDPLPLSG